MELQLFNTMHKIHIEISFRNCYHFVENTFIDSSLIDIENYHNVINWIKKIYSSKIDEMQGVANISYSIDLKPHGVVKS